ncbi:hypothetical protein [Halorubrum trueperi]|jgi:hypothetical protein|uniref:Uncharacterized protein n=1 Tax=Halorubrum trueperi TaxID=2004704 RepID=A0ABD5UNL0_9EURY
MSSLVRTRASRGPPCGRLQYPTPRRDIDRDRGVEEPISEDRERTSSEDKPTVPVFYNVPSTAADRAIERFHHRIENPFRDDSPYQAQMIRLSDFIYSEIKEERSCGLIECRSAGTPRMLGSN